jgi:hypothetical protein
MRRLKLAGLVIPAVLVAGLAVPVLARAVPAIAPFPQVNKTQAADLIVTGRVVAIEDQDAKIPAPPNMVYRVAVVQVTEALKGKAENNMVRVAFQVAKNVPGVQPNPQPQPVPPVQIQPFPIKKPFQPNFNVPLNVGMEGLYYLQKNPTQKLYTLVQTYGSFVSVENNKQGFDFEVAQVKVAANPMASLKAAKAADRATAAVVLIKQYRQPVFVPGKGQVQEPINAEESKLILKGLLEAEWPVAPAQINYNTHPAIAFNMLGIGPQDGFQGAPQGVYSQPYADAAKAWLQKNWQTYQVKRFVGVNNPGGPVNGPGGPGIGPVPQPVPLPPVQGGVGAGQAGVGVAVPGIAVPVQAVPAPPIADRPLPQLPKNN